MRYFLDDIIDANSIDYELWYSLFMSKNEKLYPNTCFPNDDFREKYIAEVQNKKEAEVKFLLRRLLVHSGHFGADNRYLSTIPKDDKDYLKNLIISSEYHRRLFSKTPTHEGITWILDLLPHWPNKSIDALSSYFLCNCQMLPDNSMSGLGDAMEIISARFIEYKHEKEVLLNLTPIDFERLVAYLFKEMEYEVSITKLSHDGGIDLIAKKENSESFGELILIQCKRYKNKITVGNMREFSGAAHNFVAMHGSRHSKAVMVTASSFTNVAIREYKNDHSMSMIDYVELVKLLNKYCGTNWPTKLYRILSINQRMQV